MLQESGDARRVTNERAPLVPRLHAAHRKRTACCTGRDAAVVALLVAILAVLTVIMGTHVSAYRRVDNEYARFDADIVQPVVDFLRANAVRERSQQAMNKLEAVVDSPLGFVVEGGNATRPRAAQTQHELADLLHRFTALLPALERTLRQMDQVMTRFTAGGGGLFPFLPPPRNP